MDSNFKILTGSEVISIMDRNLSTHEFARNRPGTNHDFVLSFRPRFCFPSFALVIFMSLSSHRTLIPSAYLSTIVIAALNRLVNRTQTNTPGRNILPIIPIKSTNSGVKCTKIDLI